MIQTPTNLLIFIIIGLTRGRDMTILFAFRWSFITVEHVSELDDHPEDLSLRIR